LNATVAIVLYNFLLVMLGVVGLPIWVVVVLRSKRLRSGFISRLRSLPASQEPTVWVHAASVGEVEAAVPLVRALVARRVTVRVTAFSDTGLLRLQSHFPELGPRLAPLDLPWLARSSVRRARVRALVLLETELWPNTIHAVRRAGGVVMIASGRISDRSYPRYRSLHWILRPVLAQLDAVAARSESDRRRFLALGCDPGHVRVVGDVKLEREAPLHASDRLRAAIGTGPILLGGSTHPGEEAALLQAYASLCEAIPGLRLVLVPRHPERAGEIVELAQRGGYPVGRRSEGAADKPIVVVDTLGELSALYGLADLVFGGGTLASVGGHNLLEPIMSERVVVVGPHTQNQVAQVEALERTGALVRVEEASELATTFRNLWSDQDRNRAARAARSNVRQDAGVIARILAWLVRLGVVPDDAA